LQPIIGKNMTLFRDGECLELRRWSEPAQMVGFAACALFINLTIGYVISPLGFTDQKEVPARLIQGLGVWVAIFITSFLAPFYETIIGQWLPMVVARWAKKTPPIQILYASIWFGILHIRNGPANVIQAFGIGWVFASCFMFCRKEDWLKAYRVTTVAHILHNFVVFMLFLFFPAH